MRIAIGQLWQESNTFNRNPSRQIDYERWGVATGHDVLLRYGKTGEIGGFLHELATWPTPVEQIGLSRFVCWPWGKIDAAAWEWIKQSFIDSLQEAGKVDALLLALHGALAAEGEDDVTGALLELARGIVGPDVPIVGTLDLHANVTHKMLTQATLLVGYHTSPHLDHFETGQRAVRGLRRILDGVRPQLYAHKLPMLTPAELHNTFTGPPAPVYRQLEALEGDPHILSAGVYMVMPWFDCAELGWTVVLYADEATENWIKTSNQLAGECWDLRQPLSDVPRHSAAQAVALAKSQGGHPVVIGDGADATNSGAPGDATGLLRELLKQQPIPHGALTFVIDPDAVAVARKAGVGGDFDGFIGATFSPEFSDPVRFRGQVVKLFDLQFELNGHGGKNMPIDMGQGAVVRSDDVTVVLAERSGPGSSPLLYEAAGLDPRTCGIVIAKSPAGFRADYEPFCTAVILSDCPGCATPNWPRLKFVHAPQPVWPLQEISEPAEAEWCWEIHP